jgi:cellulose synthase (UDP-forming)
MAGHKFGLRSLVAKALGTLAAKLTVSRPAPLSAWLLRLFFRPPAGGRPDVIGIWFATLLPRLAHAIGLPAERAWFDWPVRFFFRAPPPGQPDYVRDALTRSTFWLAEQLDVVEIYRPYAWLWRVFIRAPRRKPEARLGKRIADQVERLTTPVLRTLGIMYGWVHRWLPDLPWDRWGTQIERYSHALKPFSWVAPILAILGVAALVLVGSAPLAPDSQMLFFVLTVAASLFIRRVPGRLPVLTLVALSMTATLRYIWWRSTQTLEFGGVTEALVGFALFAAEMYTWIILFLGYAQTAWPLKRRVAGLPEDTDLWPSVDIFIPTYNEAMSVVKPTVFAAQGIDWPADRLRIYLLDDGRRPEFREFAEATGITYITRDDNVHAKAGNINHALKKTRGEYIAIFDCDHIPTRSFLQTTMGNMLADPKCALVQTPHHFFSPDPFERNLDTYRKVPSESSLFYGLVQDGNDLWNATFFCGSCAVIKRAPLEEIGGVAVETVTEDAHTSLKLHRRGYNSAYLSAIQAAGLATDTLAGHIRQRIRWARGMAQIFRTDNPLLGKGLSLFQRLCYSNAMLHFFYGIPRLVFLVMPIAYLLFQLYFIYASAWTLAAFVLPHIVLANIANSRIQGKFRHSFWAEVYESVLAWYVVVPTTLAFFNPKYGKFDVTSKGGQSDGYRDWSVSRPYLFLILLNTIAFAFGLVRLFYLNLDDASTVIINLMWTTYNMVMLGAAIAVSREARQIRATHRNPMCVGAMLLLLDGRIIACHTADYSAGGLALTLPDSIDFELHTPVGVVLSLGEQQFHFDARVSRSAGTHLGVQFVTLTMEKERQLVQCTFGRADAWLESRVQHQADFPLRSLVEVVVMGFEGYARLTSELFRAIWSLLAIDRSRSL